MHAYWEKYMSYIGKISTIEIRKYLPVIWCVKILNYNQFAYFFQINAYSPKHHQSELPSSHG
jgi:hypothetical protein